MSAQNLTPEMEYMVKILEKLVNIPSPKQKIGRASCRERVSPYV